MSSKETQQIETFLGRVVNGNCLEVMQQMPDNSVDTLITDPP